ncbi:MAG: UDP-N-acetylglucosamine--N-acetylmuramyl-(pentapeptide) pyrophosphoryl-undecaprenol N-acetylglucosamine transferase [Acidimicrobiia bacterium]
MSYAIAAAGTGGHIYPALAVAQEMVTAGVERDDIAFIGADRLEATVIPEAGYELISVEMRGLRRSLSLSNLSLPFVVRRAAATVTAELRRRRVKSLLVMGGYITVPSVMAARRSDVPYVVHEQNGHPGLANRLVSRGAAKVLVAFPEAAAKLRGAQVVGNPLRRSLISMDKGARRHAARERYGLDVAGLVVGVMGGSQGAVAINNAVSRYAERPDRPALVHLVGPSHGEALLQRSKEAPIPWRIVGFENSMEDFYAACDLVVSRAGASTVSELAATATPSVLVPLEAVAQENNANYLVNAGAAVVVQQGDLGILGSVIDRLLADPKQLAAMSAAALGASRPQAAVAVAEAVIGAAGGGTK